jgi:hypothetical protein
LWKAAKYLGDPDGRTGASHSAHWESADLPAYNTPAWPLEQQRNSCPYRPVGREAGANLRLAFRSAAEGSACGFAPREMSLILTIPSPKRPGSGFEKAE